MTENEGLAFTILQSFNFATLRRTAPGEYVFFGHAPGFYNQLFPPTEGLPCTAPWEKSAMMEFFIQEAEEFFALEKPGSITSGVWGEEGLTLKDTALKAMATNLGTAQFITIHLLEEDYIERINILRKAREQILENRLLSNNLSIFKEKSRIDGLTTIFNRSTFVELLHDEIKRSQIMDYPLVLLILDIDDFKRVNDTFGHLTGDKILNAMGKTLKGSLRRNDIVARYGGEEFAVLVTHAPLDQALQLAEKIRANLAAISLPDAPGITVSIGCAAYNHEKDSPESFFKRADDALYAAKKSGKNRVCFE